jgi:hypothetical protein
LGFMGIDSNTFILNTSPPLLAGLVDEAGVDREMLREGFGSRRSVVQGGNRDINQIRRVHRATRRRGSTN